MTLEHKIEEVLRCPILGGKNPSHVKRGEMLKQAKGIIEELQERLIDVRREVEQLDMSLNISEGAVQIPSNKYEAATDNIYILCDIKGGKI